MNENEINSIIVTIYPERSLWMALFERTDIEGKAVARHVFGKEPSDAELYEFILEHFRNLQFSLPRDFKLIVKRKNPQRVQREVRREMEKAKTSSKKESFAQEAMRLELEERKKVRKATTKAEKEAQKDKKFAERQEKKKEKHRGH
jgi:hypothetical protein